MYVNVDSKRGIILFEGWLEYWSQGNIWKRFWCVLKNETLCFYNNQRMLDSAFVGSIILGPESRMEKLDGDDTPGYKFQIHTRKTTNTFKASQFTDREHWMAYVEGVTLGTVSDTIDLLPGPIQDIKNSLQKFLRNRSQKASSEHHESTSGCFKLDPAGYLLPDSKRYSQTYNPQKYVFYSDPTRTDTPSWFFPQCSRDLAIKILTVGARFGNTLMRENTNEQKNLAISKRMESASEPTFTHFIVQKSPQGYKIEVDNYHEPMQTLSEVMNFFVTTSGKMITWPMKCNSLQELGIKEDVDHPYNVNIVTTICDADSGEETVDDISDSPWQQPRGPPMIIAPPVPHVIKTRYNTMGTNLASRSVSVPNIDPQDLEHIQAIQLGKASTLSRATQNSHILRTKIAVRQEDPPDRNKQSSTAMPPIPGKSSSNLQNDPPALPPNHPPPKKSLSQSEFKLPPADSASVNGKKNTPKHTQSMSSADVQVRQISPRDQHASSKAKDELANVMAKITKKKEEPERDSTYAEPAELAWSEKTDEIKSPKDIKDSFKKKLEGIIGNLQSPALRPHVQNPSDEYESIAHYQNVNEIQIARK